MTKREELIAYWLKSAKSDLVVCEHLFEEQETFLEEVSDFNIETRYPDVKFSFFKKCTKEFTEKYFGEIKEFYRWLKAKIQSDE